MKVFTHTLYRVPTDKELLMFAEHPEMTAQEVLGEFEYIIIGRGIRNQKNDRLIVDCCEKLCELFPDNDTYKEALKMAKELIEQSKITENISNSYPDSVMITSINEFKKHVLESNTNTNTNTELVKDVIYKIYDMRDNGKLYKAAARFDGTDGDCNRFTLVNLPKEQSISIKKDQMKDYMFVKTQNWSKQNNK